MMHFPAKEVSIVRGSVTNWIQVGLFLRNVHQGNGHCTDLRFRNGDTVSAVDKGLAWALIVYYYYSRRFGVYRKADLVELVDVFSDISSKTTDTLGKFRGSNGWFGGSFASKEALLFVLAKKLRPSVVIETGVGHGVSSYVLLDALKSNGQGKLVSIDWPNRDPKGYRYPNGRIDPVYLPPALHSGWLVPPKLKSRWTLLEGKSADKLPSISDSIDMFFHDSEHSYQNTLFEFEWAWSHLKGGGALAADDIGWNNAFGDFIRKHRDIVSTIRLRSFGCLIKGQKHFAKV